MANPKEILLKSIQMVIKIDILRLFNKKERISGMRAFPQCFFGSSPSDHYFFQSLMDRFKEPNVKTS